MKISLLMLTATLLLAAGGCARPVPRGGSEAAIEGQARQQDARQATLADNDYRRMLSDPGPF